MSIDVTFFESTPFPLSSSVTSQGEDDDLLVYIISSPNPTPTPTPTPTRTPTPVFVPVPVKPSITQVYSLR